MELEEIQIVWFKRDLRLIDHAPLKHAVEDGTPLLLLYSFEPLWVNDAHYSARHIDFIKQSLLDLQSELSSYETSILIVENDILETLESISTYYRIKQLHSYQETGLKITYDRDLAVASYCKTKKITWYEHVANGVYRGLKNRENWAQNWIDFINLPLDNFKLEKANFLKASFVKKIEKALKLVSLDTTASGFQPGGTRTAIRYLDSFLENRIAGYNAHYSKPLTSRKHSSRLSPYIAWGNLSMRMIIKKAAATATPTNSHLLDSFLSRLRWQAHFIQKFEMEYQLEWRSVHQAYRALDKPINEKLQDAWRTGRTGFPMVDAAMRCLNETGFVNFRLRAMLASFLIHNLWQPWQAASVHLAQQFLDFEPGIHYPQLQMQAGETGINTVRIYSPVKNSLDHDPEALFLKEWLPELAHLPLALIHEPWNATALEKKMCRFKLGIDYPHRIVDITKTRQHAQDTLYGIQNDIKSQTESNRVIQKHTNPDRKIWSGTDGLI